MDTDHIFHELFRDRPEWLREFTGLPLPPGCRGRSLALKQILGKKASLVPSASGALAFAEIDYRLASKRRFEAPRTRVRKLGRKTKPQKGQRPVL